MLTQRYVIGFFALTIIAASGVTRAQEYPSKPVRIVTSGVGGSSDITARLVAQGISTGLGQQITIDNRPSGAIQGDLVAKSPPDGYTLLIAGGTLWTFPLLQKTSYDPARDFAAITLIEVSVNVVAVHPSLPVKSVKELIAFAKARPGELNYFSSGSGSTSHLTMELFKSLAGVNVVHVPYKSNSMGMTDLIGGQLQLGFPSATSAAPHAKSGRIRTLAVSSTQPSALAPGLPPVAATVPGYEAVSMTGFFAPVKTPAPIINRLNQEVVRFLKTPDAREKFFTMGAEAVGSTPEQMATALKEEVARMDKLIKAIGLRAD
jgi:tripartite-type tricarboxylate transporter receptor subunit TctC